MAATDEDYRLYNKKNSNKKLICEIRVGVNGQGCSYDC